MRESDPYAADGTPLEGVDSLLYDVLDRDGPQRAQRLDALRVNDARTAAQVAELVDVLDAFGLLREPSVTGEKMERFGPFRILSVLGHGGMGTVYLAEQEELGRQVALKVIHGGQACAPRVRERFRREAIAAARLAHPAICQVFEAGEIDGTPYIAMRHVPGASLDRLLARSRDARRTCVALPGLAESVESAAAALDRILVLVGTLASALHAAHESGLVHRDVKPANILVGDDGQPVLVDFGLASLDEGAGPGLTLSGDRVGTPHYMAPEQIKGGPVDRRCDVYALGVVLHECLTLHPPFDAVHRESLFRQILNADPADPRRHNRAIGRDLLTVLRTAMAREPDRRYRTAQALAEDLRRIRAHEPILARRAGMLLRLQRFARRNPVAAAFVVFLLVAIVAFAVILDRARGLLRTATANEQALRANAYAQASPLRGLEAALAAVDAERNVDTLSALYSATVSCRERAVLQHEGPVWMARFSPDGQRIVTCSDDFTARLWHRHGGLLAVMQHEGEVRAVHFAPDGQRIVTASKDGTAKIWDAEGKLLWTLEHPRQRQSGIPRSHWVMSAAFDPEGRRVATVQDRLVFLWDAETGKALGAPWEGHEGSLWDLCWSPDGKLLATAETDFGYPTGRDRFEIRLWNPDRPAEPLVASFAHKARVHRLAFSPDSRTLASAASDNTACLWDVTGERPPITLLHEGMVYSAHFSADGERILTSGLDGRVRLWNRAGGQTAAWNAGMPTGAVFAGGGRWVIAHCEDSSVRLLDADLNEQLVLRGHRDVPWGEPALSPDGSLIASPSFDCTVRLWDLVDSELPRLLGHRHAVRGLALLPDGRVASVGADRTLRLWDLTTSESRSLSLPLPAFGLTLSADGATALVTHPDSSARAYDLATGAQKAVYPRDEDYEPGALFLADGRVLVGGRGQLFAFSPDGKSREVFARPTRRTYVLARPAGPDLIAASGWDPSIWLWDHAGEKLSYWPAHASWVNVLAFAPAASLLASGSNDKKVRVWGLADPRQPTKVAELLGHDGKVMTIAWSPDGRLLASGGSDGTVHLWNTATWELIAVLRGHRVGGVSALLFTSDGRLLSGGDDGAIQTWPTSTLRLIDLARARVDRLRDDNRERTSAGTLLAEFRFAVWFGESDDAVALGRQLVDEAIAARNGQQLNQIAATLVDPTAPIQRRDLDLALAAAIKAVEFQPAQSGFLHTLARAWFWKGDYHKALELQQKAVDARPDLPLLQQTLEEYRRRVAEPAGR